MLTVMLIPFTFGYGFIGYEIYGNHAVERAYAEAIAIGVVGAILPGIALLGGAVQRPLVFASYFVGIAATNGSAVFLFLLSQPRLLGFDVGNPWLALVPFSLTLAGAIALGIRYRHMIEQRQAGVVGIDVSPYLALIPALKVVPQHSLWSHYDPEADTLAIHFTEPDTHDVASDSDITDDGVVVRRNDAGEVIGLTIPHASSRMML
jgi:uncharacterized protein YuzE